MMGGVTTGGEVHSGVSGPGEDVGGAGESAGAKGSAGDSAGSAAGGAGWPGGATMASGEADAAAIRRLSNGRRAAGGRGTPLTSASARTGNVDSGDGFGAGGSACSGAAGGAETSAWLAPPAPDAASVSAGQVLAGVARLTVHSGGDAAGAAGSTDGGPAGVKVTMNERASGAVSIIPTRLRAGIGRSTGTRMCRTPEAGATMSMTAPAISA